MLSRVSLQNLGWSQPFKLRFHIPWETGPPRAGNTCGSASPLVEPQLCVSFADATKGSAELGLLRPAFCPNQTVASSGSRILISEGAAAELRSCLHFVKESAAKAGAVEQVAFERSRMLMLSTETQTPNRLSEGGAVMNDTLALIAELRRKLNIFPKATPDECWTTVQAIESGLSRDPKYTPRERVLLQHVKSAVSDIIAAYWEGIQVPSGLALLPLSALDGSIRRGRQQEERR